MMRSEQDGSFSAALRDATFALHREAERTGFVADLIRGRATREGYARYLANLSPVYGALEHALTRGWSADSILTPMLAPALHRSAALQADLGAITGGQQPSSLVLLPEAHAYAAAIRAAADARSGPRVMAHAYARYLGDLSGGQILKPLLGRTLQLTPDMLTFYDFPGLDDLGRAKQSIRTALDTIVVGSPDGDDLIEEAKLAFRQTILLSVALSSIDADAGCP